MNYYITLEKPRHRYGFYTFAIKEIFSCQFNGKVVYNPGGWNNKEIKSVLPHLEFENGEDALAYNLVYGGRMFTKIPCEGD